jgi:GMP synthase-like glutamine amidotransferase
VSFSSVKPRLKLYVIGTDGGYSTPWLSLFELTKDPLQADVVLFTGGSDISPELYGEENKFSHPYPERDQFEVPWYQWAVQNDKAIIGICRGAQLVCALSGGKLYQDVSGHTVAHKIVTDDGRVMGMSSVHHQMMRPAGNYVLLAWSEKRSHYYRTGDNATNTRSDLDVDPEIVWYPDIKALCIQGHPEFMNPATDGVKYCLELAQRFIIDGEKA